MRYYKLQEKLEVIGKNKDKYISKDFFKPNENHMTEEESLIDEVD